MARYIDADKLVIEEFPLKDHELIKVNECAFFGRRNGKAIMQIKDYLKRMIDNAPTEDVVPRSEVEALTDERDRYKRYYFNHAYDELEAEAKQEVARELLNEIKTKVNSLIDFYRHHTTVLSTVRAKVDAYFEIDGFIAELEKKYIGEKK